MIHTQHGNVFAPAIEARASHQRARVQDGLQSGTISGSELSSLRDMRSDARQGLAESKADNGWVGPVERRQVHQDLNQINRSIFAFKHNQ